ncbi:MAG TPA: DUF4928 family protein [Pirellulales bacterium]|nr:DUF4928 family protein [Pirellulales bacterium]
MSLNFDDFAKNHMKKGSHFVAARLQTALALLEKLRDCPSLNLDDHLASKGSSGLESHETFGNRAHSRLSLEPINRNHGRRSSSLQDWGQQLLDIIGAAGFTDASPGVRNSLVDLAQSAFAAILRDILEQEPLEVRVRGRSAEAALHDVLKQAEEKGKSGDVAQYLVGAKLMLRFSREIPVFPANKGDRKSRSDRGARLGDFEIENAVIEVAVGLPDEKHISQIAEVLEDTDSEVWVLTRVDRVVTWKNEICASDGLDSRRVVVASVESFVGQNVTELGEFSAKGKLVQLEALFDLYNTRWVANVGTPGIRILIK